MFLYSAFKGKHLHNALEQKHVTDLSLTVPCTIKMSF